MVVDAPHPMRTWAHDRRPLVASVCMGALAAAFVALGTLFLALSQPVSWQATSSLVVLPASDLDSSSVAGFYETLSRGQIPATFAQIIRLQRFESAAADRLELSEAQRAEVDLDVEVVPDTAIVQLTVTAPQSELAGAMVDETLAEADRYVAGLATPYSLAVIDRGAGSVERSSPPTLSFLLVGALVALAIGVAVQQATFALGKIVRTPSDRPTISPAPEAEPPVRLDPSHEDHRPPPATVADEGLVESRLPVPAIQDADLPSAGSLLDEDWLDDLRRLREEISAEATELLTKAAEGEGKSVLPSSSRADDDGPAHPRDAENQS